MSKVFDAFFSPLKTCLAILQQSGSQPVGHKPMPNLNFKKYLYYNSKKDQNYGYEVATTII